MMSPTNTVKDNVQKAKFDYSGDFNVELFSNWIMNSVGGSSLSNRDGEL